MNTTANLYIGADNITGITDIETINNILGKCHPNGYTVFGGNGVWHGQSEPCTMAVVTGTQQEIQATAELLRDELRQEAIGVQFTAPIAFI